MSIFIHIDWLKNYIGNVDNKPKTQHIIPFIINIFLFVYVSCFFFCQHFYKVVTPFLMYFTQICFYFSLKKKAIIFLRMRTNPTLLFFLLNFCIRIMTFLFRFVVVWIILLDLHKSKNRFVWNRPRGGFWFEQLVFPFIFIFILFLKFWFYCCHFGK